MVGSISTSIASAASRSQFRSWFSFLTLCWAFSISFAVRILSRSLGKKPLSIVKFGMSSAAVALAYGSHRRAMRTNLGRATSSEPAAYPSLPARKAAMRIQGFVLAQSVRFGEYRHPPFSVD